MKEKIYRAFNDDIENVCLIEPQNDILPSTQDEMDAITDYEKQFLMRFTYNSNAIEGSTLTLGDTELIFEGEFPIETEGKKLSDVFAAIGIKEGVELADRLLDEHVKFDDTVIKDIHQATALDCQPRTRGVYRVTPVYIAASETVPPAPEKVGEYMADLLFAYNSSTNAPIAKAAAFHAMFEHIHPFRDGNGRTGRILLNMMLKKSGYPPIAIKSAGKGKYLSALEDWQVRGNPMPLLSIIEQQIVEETAARKSVLTQTRRAVAARPKSWKETKRRIQNAQKAEPGPDSQGITNPGRGCQGR